jgi:hypothetical protein
MEQTKVEIVMVSGACCAPNLAKTEADLEARILQTIQQLDMDAELNIVSLGAVLNGEDSLAAEQSQLIQALFQKYGVKFTPAGLNGTKVLFAGGASEADKMKELLGAL